MDSNETRSGFSAVPLDILVRLMLFDNAPQNKP